MQYFLGSDSNRNVYADSNGVFQSVCDVSGTSDFFPCYSSSLWPSPSSQVLVDTEVLKQTIYCHEAIFRNQVIELHRLYGKQRELINELKSDFSRESVAHTNQFRMEVSENVCTGKATDQVECASRKIEMLDVSKCKKYNNKVLDLQLLATEYMDDEADYGYVPPISSANGEHNDQQTLAHEKGTFVESASARPILFDLNEPFNYEEATPTTSHEEKPFKDLSKNTTQLVSYSSGGTDRNVHGSVAIYNDINILDCDHERGQRTTDSDSLNQDSNPSSSVISPVSPILNHKPCNERLGIDDKLKRPSKKRTLNSRKAQRCLAFLKNKTQDTLIRVPKSLETQSKNILPAKQSVFDLRRNPIAIQALPCTNAPVTNQRKKSKSFSTATEPERNKSHLSEVQCRKSSTKNILSSPSSDVVKTPRKCKKRRSCFRAGNLFRGSYRVDPSSPENDKCAPSDKNFLGKRHHFYEVNDSDTGTDVARIAAKALVLLSAADVCINSSSVSESPHHSPENPLHWFAEIVSDAEFATEDFPIYSLDDFETMTLRLEDTSKEDYYSHSVIANQDEKLRLVATVPVRATRVRGKRSKKLKDFQGVILPGISSLSKHEVTEDLHFIKELIQSTGTRNIFSSKKRNGCSSRVKRQSITPEISPCLPLHLQNETGNDSDTNVRKRMMIDWGNVTRRRRGRRYPARRLTFIQEGHTLKAH